MILNFESLLNFIYHQLVYSTKPNGLAFELIGMRTLSDTILLSTRQFKKWVQKDVELFTINVHELINELVNEIVQMKWWENF